MLGKDSLSDEKQIRPEVSLYNQIEGFELLTSLLLKSKFGIYRTTPNGKFLYGNKNLYRLLGIKNKKELEAINLNEAGFIESEERDKFISLFNNSQNELIEFETHWRRNDGKSIFLREIARAVKDENGNILYFEGIIENISNQKEANKLLHLFTYAVDQSVNSIIITDSKGNIEYVNKKFTEQSGYTQKEVMNKSSRILKSGKMEAYIYKNLWETISSGNIWKGELYNRRKNNEFYWVSSIINPIKDENDRTIHYLAINQDITQQKLAENALIQTNEKLKSALASKDKFFSLIAHDLRSPFNSLLGYSELLTEEYDNFREDERKEMLKSMRFTLESSFRLLENLLNWARSQTKTLQVYRQHTNLNQLLTELKLSYSAEAAKKNINLIAHFPDAIYANIDEIMIRTVFRNILQNAIKFTPDGGKIVLTSFSENIEYKGFIKVNIEDSGIGIPEELIDKIFQPDDHTKRPGTQGELGSGLGLIISKEFLNLNHAYIQVESEVNKGSVFSVFLPTN